MKKRFFVNTTLPSLIILLSLIIVISVICLIFKKRLNFFITGLDSGFKHSEISLLWRLSKKVKMDDPSALFWSVSALDRNISYLLAESKKNGTEYSKQTQEFLEKLYAYRTKICLDPLNHKGLQDTRKLLPGQKVVVLMKAKNGVHLAKIVKVGKNIEITLPVYKKTGEPLFQGSTWVKQAVSVYFMRKDDAAYVFDTVVLGTGFSGDGTTLALAHSNKMVRTQKRKSVRASCKIPGQLYIARNGPEELRGVSIHPGLKCLIEDISEDGAQVRIGGHGVKNLLVKIQFSIGDSLIVMGGTVRGVEYNAEKNQSLLHIESLNMDRNMKNAILGFVYNVLPQKEKDEAEAVSIVEENKDEVEKEAMHDGVYGEAVGNVHDGVYGEAVGNVHDFEKTTTADNAYNFDDDEIISEVEYIPENEI